MKDPEVILKKTRDHIVKKIPKVVAIGLLLSVAIPFDATTVSANGQVNEVHLVSKYRVRPGDTLYKIAKKFNTTVNELKDVNGLTSNVIHIRQQLKIPNEKGRYYNVQPGDTLWEIAGWFNMTINQVKLVNHLTSNLIYSGQALYIPERKTVTTVNQLPKGIFHVGNRGIRVQKIQKALNYFGYALDVDGIYGPITKKTITDFQSQFQQLVNDGIYGPQTKSYLQNAILTDHKIVSNPTSTLVLVNKHHSLPRNYVPKNLVMPDVRFLYKGDLPKKHMRKEAADALAALFNKANQEKIYLFAVSGYRSFDRQYAIFSSKAMRMGMEKANLSSAKPGESEHQTGLAMDVTSQSAGFHLTQAFGQTKEGRWLKKHAADFGFIIRYPKGKTWITGYEYEPWHLRYVGKYAAKRISNWNVTFEEYLGVK